MEIGLILRQILSGLSIGSTFGLMAVGLSLIFGLLGIVNFAQFAFWAIGAYVAIDVLRGMGTTFWVAIIVGMAVTAAIGIFIERVFLRRLYGQDPSTTLIFTFGVALILIELIRIIHGISYHPFALPQGLGGSVSLFGHDFPSYRIFYIGISGLIFYLIWALLNKTSLGLQIRAGIQDRDMARALGINIGAIFTFTLAVGVGLAGLGGGLSAPLGGVSPDMGTDVMLISFAVIVIGGMGSLTGTIVASYITGLLSSFMTLISPALSEIVIFIFMAIIILGKPGGLFGEVTKQEH